MASCDPSTLAQQASCIDCGIPPGMRDAVMIYLLCQIAGVSTDPNFLVQQAACIDCGIPKGDREAVMIYLFCQIAGV